MTLQWTAVAFFLYAEIGLNLILCIPFISAKRYCSITHVPWLQTSVKLRCHCCPLLKLSDSLCSSHLLCSWHLVFNWRIWKWLSPYWNKCFFTMIMVLIVLLLGKCYWLTVCHRRQHHFTLPLIFRCCTRGAQVLRAWASAWCQSKPECLWPCAHEAVQSSEEPVHIWLLSLSLAVSVFVFIQDLIIILLNCSLTRSFIYLCSVSVASCAGSLAC